MSRKAQPSLAIPHPKVRHRTRPPQLAPSAPPPAANDPVAAEPPVERPDDDTYDVGYRKPPEHSRFKKGQSGNPKGRPKGARNMQTEYQEVMKGSVDVVVNGVRRPVSSRRAMALKMREKALKGDLRALMFLSQSDEKLATELTGRSAGGGIGGDPFGKEADRDYADLVEEFRNEIEAPIEAPSDPDTPAKPKASRSQKEDGS